MYSTIFPLEVEGCDPCFHNTHVFLSFINKLFTFFHNSNRKKYVDDLVVFLSVISNVRRDCYQSGAGG